MYINQHSKKAKTIDKTKNAVYTYLVDTYSNKYAE